jgi:hypothetical protein
MISHLYKIRQRRRGSFVTDGWTAAAGFFVNEYVHKDIGIMTLDYINPVNQAFHKAECCHSRELKYLQHGSPSY